MSLLGQAIVAIWNDIAPEGRANFYEWHNRQHMLERVGIPGFRRGRRFIAHGQDSGSSHSATPEFFTLYEADELAVLSGAEYQARLNNPTDWTQRTVPDYRNLSRSLCRVETSLGTGIGGYLATARLDTTIEDSQAFAALLTAELCPAIADLPQIVGTHFGITDVGASSVQSAEKRGQTVAVPLGVVMIDACSAQALDEPLRRLVEAGGSAGIAIAPAVYRLEIALSA